MTLGIRNVVAIRSTLSLVFQNSCGTGAMYLGLQSKVPGLLGYARTHFVPCSFTRTPHWGGMFLPGSVGACSPPAVQLCTWERWFTMHCRVKVDPHALAAVAHIKKDDTPCSPSWLTEPPSPLTMLKYCCTAGTMLASSSGMNAIRTYELLP